MVRFGRIINPTYTGDPDDPGSFGQGRACEFKNESVKILDILENESAYHGKMVVIEGKIGLDALRLLVHIE